MGKPSPPPPPDYAAAAKAQGDANLTGAEASNYLNQANQVGPNGSITYSYDPSQGHTLKDGTFIPQTTATTTLSPDQQKLYDQNTNIAQSLNGLAQKGIGYVGQATATPTLASQFNPLTQNLDPKNLQTSYDFSKASPLPGMNDFAAQRDQVTNALMSRMSPELDRAQAAKENQLANQGINPGSDAYATEEKYLGQNRNDAQMQAVLGGSQEQQRLYQDAVASHQQGISEATAQGDLNNTAQNAMFGQGLSSGQFGNAAQQQAIQEADYFKNQPLNMLNALRSGNQTTMPQFGNVAGGAQVAAAPVYAAANDQYNAQMQGYNAQMQAMGALMGGLGTLGGAAVTKWSDRRLKENIRKIGERVSGLGIYMYNYLWNPATEIGYMADEVEGMYPEAVSYVNGYAQVDYARIG